MEDSNVKEKKKPFAFLKKFKNIKGFEVVIVIVLVAVMLLIAFGSFDFSKNKTNDNIEINSAEAYAKELESKLNAVLSNIKGAGNVSTMITLEGGYELTIGYYNEEKTTTGTNGSTSTENKTVTQNVIYVTENGEEVPLVLYKKNPVIKGVVIVASGADDMNVKLDLIRASQTLLNIEASCIEVFVGK